MIEVRQLEPGERDLYRTIRLAALSDAPSSPAAQTARPQPSRYAPPVGAAPRATANASDHRRAMDAERLRLFRRSPPAFQTQSFFRRGMLPWIRPGVLP